MIPGPVIGGTIGYAAGCIFLLLVLKVGQVGFRFRLRSKTSGYNGPSIYQVFSSGSPGWVALGRAF